MELPFNPLAIDPIKGMSTGTVESSTAVELSNGVTVGVCLINASVTGSEEWKFELLVELNAAVEAVVGIPL